MHSVKNRFLMRIKNITPDLYKRNWLSITARDLVVMGCCILREHSSLRAFSFVLRNWKRFRAKRKEIMARRKVSDAYMAAWFHYQPVALPMQKSAKLVSAKPAPARGVRVEQPRAASR